MKIRTMANTIIPEKLKVRPIIALTLGVNVALILADIEYWTPRANDTPKKGWFYKSQPDLCLETGLSRDQQDRCIPILIEHDFIEYRVGGGNVRHFRLKPKIVENYEKTMRLNHTQLCDIAARKCGRKSHTITIRVSNNKQGNVNQYKNYKQTTQYKTEPNKQTEPVANMVVNNNDPPSTKGYEAARLIAEQIKARKAGRSP